MSHALCQGCSLFYSASGKKLQPILSLATLINQEQSMSFTSPFFFVAVIVLVFAAALAWGACTKDDSGQSH